MATILLIEDDDCVRTTMAATLRYLGHTVIQASDGNEGLERHALGLGDFDLVICDLQLPRISGPMLIEKLLERAPHTAILAISAAADALESIRPRLGAEALLAKPFTWTELSAATERLLGSQSSAGLDRLADAVGPRLPDLLSVVADASLPAA